jgi:hypothetical protein
MSTNGGGAAAPRRSGAGTAGAATAAWLLLILLAARAAPRTMAALEPKTATTVTTTTITTTTITTTNNAELTGKSEQEPATLSGKLPVLRQLQEADAENSACVVEYASFTDCVAADNSSNGDSGDARAVGGCDNCVVSYWNVSTEEGAPVTAEYCEQLQRGTCQGWHSCKTECPRRCRSELVTLIDCITHCALTPLNQCPERNRTGTVGGGTVAPTLPVPAPATNTPTLMLTTPPPTSLVVAPPQPVPTSPTTPSLDVCARQRSDLNACWLQQADSSTAQKNACARCHLLRLSGFNSSTLCVEYQPHVCDAIQQCPCGDCTYYQVQLTECLTACTFECAPASGSAPAPSTSPLELPSVPTRFPTKSPELRAVPFPTLAPTAALPSSTTNNNVTNSTPKCPDQQALLNECLAFNGTASDRSPCELCVVSAWPEIRQECSDIDNATCQGLELCQEECQNCTHEFLEYATCETSCSFPCTGNSSSTPVVSRNVTACQQEYAAFDSCVNPVLLGYACEQCVTAYWSAPTGNVSAAAKCGDLNSDTCFGLLQCSDVCHGCGAELFTVVRCVSDCNLTNACSSNETSGPPSPSAAPTLASPNPTVSAAPTAAAAAGDCTDKDRAVVQCFVFHNRTAAPCGGCVSDLSPGPCPLNGTDANLCGLFEEQCGSLCEPCGTQIQEAVDCYAALQDCGAVQLVCSSTTNGTNSSSSSGPTAAASPVPTPTVAPSPVPSGAAVETCPDEMGAVDKCLTEQLDSSEQKACVSCVETVYGNFMKDLQATNSSSSTTTTTPAEACAKVNDAVCRALSQSCVCGPCTSAYQSYLDCRVGKLPTAQEGECQLSCNRTTINRGNSSDRSTSGGCGTPFPKGFVSGLTSLAALYGMIWLL